jgi:hypothetical protein
VKTPGAEKAGPSVAVVKGAVEVDDGVAPGKFERAPARTSRCHRHFRNDAGISAAGRVVMPVAADAVARLDIAAVEIERRPLSLLYTIVVW